MQDSNFACFAYSCIPAYFAAYSAYLFHIQHIAGWFPGWFLALEAFAWCEGWLEALTCSCNTREAALGRIRAAAAPSQSRTGGVIPAVGTGAWAGLNSVILGVNGWLRGVHDFDIKLSCGFGLCNHCNRSEKNVHYAKYARLRYAIYVNCTICDVCKICAICAICQDKLISYKNNLRGPGSSLIFFVSSAVHNFVFIVLRVDLNRHSHHQGNAIRTPFAVATNHVQFEREQYSQISCVIYGFDQGSHHRASDRFEVCKAGYVSTVTSKHSATFSSGEEMVSGRFRERKTINSFWNLSWRCTCQERSRCQ